jgi:predicted MFS family arabinose efflux permease
MKSLVLLGYSLILAGYVGELWGHRFLAWLAVGLAALLSLAIAFRPEKPTDPGKQGSPVRVLEDLKHRGVINDRQFVKLLAKLLIKR